MLYQNIKNGEGLTILEPKGDLAEKVYSLSLLYGRKCLYFNPANLNCPKFNPLAGDMNSVIENMVLCFRMILAESPDFFKDNCETLLRNSIKIIKCVKPSATLIDLERFVNNAGGYRQQILNRFQMQNAKESNIEKKREYEDVLNYFITQYFNEKNDTFQNTSSIRIQLNRLNSNKYLRSVLNPKDEHSNIDFLEHIESGGILAMTTNQGTLGLTLSRLLGFFLILNFQSAVFRRKGNEHTRKPHFLYIDEFQEFANPSFGILLTQSRSYRVACILATQNRQLISGDGSREGEVFLELVSANASNIILFPDLPPNDCEYFSRNFGDRTVMKTSKSRSRQANNIAYNSITVSTSQEYEQNLTATQISQLKFGEVVYKIMDGGTAKIAGIGKVFFYHRTSTAEAIKSFKKIKN